MHSGPTSIGGLLAGTTHARLLAIAQRLQQLTQAVVESLPEPLNQHCVAASIQGDTLVLVTDSAAWSLQLRYHAPDIFRQLARRRGLKLRTVRVKIHPLQVPRTQRHPRRLALSRQNSELIRQTAAGLRDPALKSALLRLSRHSV
ncbi:MAG: DUF721 domain-containing protein [Gammaproteobacteria bacterium]|nr:DUF721 domain-containing protein [Gammaproteobacteria bacterium]